MADRADPMVAAAQIVVAVRDAAAKQADARATVGA
ncbi:N-carbamoyl-L-amino acid amidohydrolase [Arthrobacter sp. Hiyo8]|nr:N-carbamoyl-L-amino acid amidohydrolase [Arthrobacter sp. Hiyo8]